MLILGCCYTRKAVKLEDSGLAGLQWDSAELREIGVQTEMSYDDAFIIEKVARIQYLLTMVHSFIAFTPTKKR